MTNNAVWTIGMFWDELRNIITLMDTELVYMSTTLDDVDLDFYRENGIIDWVTFAFRDNTGYRINIPSGVDRTEMLDFFTDTFTNITRDEFITKFVKFINDITGDNLVTVDTADVVFKY
jgi:hypothetical protein